MLIHELQAYLDGAPDCAEIGVVIRFINTGIETAATFNVVANIDEYGQLLLNIVI